MKKTQLFCILIFSVIVVRFFYFFAQPDLSSDHLLQMAMAQNFMGGEGFSFKYLNSMNEIFYTTNIQSPPFYPFILASFTFLTSNTLLSSFITQVTVLILLVFIWKKIFNLFDSLISKDAYYYFIALSISSTSILNNINTILIFALLLLTVSLYFTLAYLFSNRSKKTNLFFASFFAALLFWTHYSYFFVAFFPAIVLFIIYYLSKEKSHLFAGIGSFSISLIISLGVLIYNLVSTGYVNYMDNPHIWDAGFFPEHLLLTDPFFLNAFFKTSYFLDYLFTSNHIVLYGVFFQFISLLIFFVIITLFLKLRKFDRTTFKEKLYLFIPFIVITALTLSFLLYFTLHYHEIPRPNWQHIGDSRYLSSVYISVLVVVVMLIFIKADYIHAKYIRILKAILISLIFVNLCINIFITFKEWGNYSFVRDTYKVPGNELQELFQNIKHELLLGNTPIFIDNQLTVRSFRISQYAGAAVIDSNELTNIKQFPSNMVFLFFLPSEEQFRNEDLKILEWGEKFNLIQVGKVYTGLKLFKIYKL